MVSTTSLLLAAVIGYLSERTATCTGTATSAWIVQIDPQFEADWQSVSGDTELIAIYVEKAKAAGYENDIRKLLDSDTKLYGADCGFTNPDADPKDSPTDGTATFSRGIAHHGSCEIWLDDTMVLHDDCAKTFGTENYETEKSILKPIDYSSCLTSGCMLRFYWVAFQGVNGKYVWQIYTEGQTSTASVSSASASSNITQTAKTPATTTESTTTKSSEATETETSTTTPLTTEKCNARRRV